MKRLSKALKISPLLVFPERPGFGEMAFHRSNPKKNQKPRSTRFSEYLWLRNSTEIHPGRDHTEPLEAGFKYKTMSSPFNTYLVGLICSRSVFTSAILSC